MLVRSIFPSHYQSYCSPSAGTTAMKWLRSTSSSRNGDPSALSLHWSCWTTSMPTFRYPMELVCVVYVVHDMCIPGSQDQAC